MPLQQFHPAVAGWFRGRFGAPSEAQARGWPEIRSGRSTLIAAPTGSGKTLAAFLAAIDDLIRLGLAGELRDETRVLYVSPLKALSNDIHKNLQEPVAGIRAELAPLGLPDVDLRMRVRTGDTPASERTATVRRPPHLLVTTPESLYLLLTSDGGRGLLGTVRTVIVDEIHALVPSKRGSHLALSLERLEALTGRRLVRIGLSATQRPLVEVARFLVGARDIAAGDPDCVIVDAGHQRDRDLAIEVPGSPLEPVMSAEVWEEIYDRLAELIEAHRTTLVFVNTRRQAERVTRHLDERLGADRVATHHGSLARPQRLRAEQRLKAGELRAVVATASLELGIDIGTVDLVCQLGSTRSIATWLQRAGRSGHGMGRLPKGRLFPLSRDELVESVALLDAVRRDELDRVSIPRAPLDILAQQLVAELGARGEPIEEDGLFELVRRAHPYRGLERSSFDAVVTMLVDGFTTRRGRRGAYLHRDGVHRRLRARRSARLVAITGGGAIPDNADYDVILDPQETFLGTLNEDFAIESIPGDIFQLGNASWRIVRVETGRVRVEDAHGQPPNLPFWLGEAPSRTPELSVAVARLREEVGSRLDDGHASRWLIEEVGVGPAEAEQVVEYLLAAQRALGAMPTQDTLVVERFFDDSGGMQLVFHAPFGSRLNRALGLALRKRFCQRFNFELQAAATEDAIVLSLGPTHSFPLEEVFTYLHPASVRDVLVQALLLAPMFATRWRWNATRALAIPRLRGGRRVPPRLLRMQADDLVALVFPDQLACAENLAGPREVPEHPLVEQTVRDCLEEAMDIERLEALLASIRAGQKRLVACDLTEPSPLAREVLTARPYAFLDDAPLEERRTQAVQARRWIDPERAADLGALDAAAIARVREEAWPTIESAEELHDALATMGALTEGEGAAISGGGAWLDALAAQGRAATLRVPEGPLLWVANERLDQVRSALLDGDSLRGTEALRELVRGRLEVVGPTTVDSLRSTLGVATRYLEAALAALEAEGFVLRGWFTPGRGELEWCDRRLLARIHRYTLGRLRREIQPCSPSDYLRFLIGWQRVAPEQQAEGIEGLAAVLERLEGFAAPVAAWERDILPARVVRYEPAWLDALCLSGRVAWLRLRPAPSVVRPVAGPMRSTPMTLVARRHLDAWLRLAPRDEAAEMLSGIARAVLVHLEARGASFFEEIVRHTKLGSSEVAEALAELASLGRVTSDGFGGLRALVTPTARRRPGSRSRRHPAAGSLDGAGRWSAVRAGGGYSGEPEEPSDDAPAMEVVARALLRRYGVVFRRILDREAGLPPWRQLLRALRWLEGRGDARGGRFVSGHTGEQFALPEAVEQLREVRRRLGGGGEMSVSAADPLNLVGVLTPGPKVPAIAANRVVLNTGPLVDAPVEQLPHTQTATEPLPKPA